MFIYNGKEYDKVWFTSDEHYGSDRHIVLSCRLEFQDLVKEKQIEKYKETLNNAGMSEDLKHYMVMNFKHSVYGGIFETPVNKMNDKFISNHNKRVGDNDIVFHLGDFGDYGCAKYLNGHHVLIMGNYEAKDLANNYDRSFEDYKQKIVSSYNFIDVLMDYTLDLNENNKNNVKFGRILSNEVGKIFMTHQPTFCEYDYKNDKYKKCSSDDRIIMNLFGHIHEKAKVKRCGLNVGVDGHHFYPVSQEEVEFYLYAILHH